MKRITSNLGSYLLLLAVSMITFFGCQDGEDLNKADFIGSYAVAEVCNGNNVAYTLTIADVSGTDDVVTITNLWDWEETMNATISGSSITIPSQLSDDFTFSGSGELSGNTLVITYMVDDNSGVENCVATATKQ